MDIFLGMLYQRKLYKTSLDFNQDEEFWIVFILLNCNILKVLSDNPIFQFQFLNFYVYIKKSFAIMKQAFKNKMLLFTLELNLHNWHNLHNWLFYFQKGFSFFYFILHSCQPSSFFSKQINMVCTKNFT